MAEVAAVALRILLSRSSCTLSLMMEAEREEDCTDKRAIVALLI